MRLLEAGRRGADSSVGDVVRAARTLALGNTVQRGQMTHAVSDRVVGTGRITADAKAADDLPALIERDATAESNNAAGDESDAGALCFEDGIERIGVVQTIQRSARLGRGIQVRRRQR